MIKILIADDHAIVRKGLKQLFSMFADVQVVCEVASGARLLEVLRETEADLVLLDMSMPGISGVNLISRIRLQHKSIPILVLSMHNEPQIARRALGAGACGYLTKDNDPETLLVAIRKVAAGGRYIDSVLAEMMAFESGAASQRPPHELLSERELDIMRLLVQGVSVNEIADQFSISNKTVSTHKARLMQKMNFRNNAEMVRYGIDHGLG